MNISVYAFGQFEMGYSQYPDDYTGDIFTEFYKHSKAKTQIAIHRDGSLMYYGYIRKLEQNRYIGLCAVVNGQMFVQIKPLFSMFEGIIEEMVEKEQLIQMGNYGEVTTKASSLYLKENDIKELSNKLRRQLENQNCITMPPINNSVSKDSIQNFNLEDDSNQIIQSIGKYGYTYIYKSNGYDTDRLKGFSEKIFQLNKEHEEALEEIRKLKKTSRKIIDRDSESTYKGLIWLLLGVIVILFIVIALSKKDQEINDDSNETTTPVATSEESYNSYLNSTNNSIVKEDDDSEPKEEIVEVVNEDAYAPAEELTPTTPISQFNFNFEGSINGTMQIVGNLYTQGGRVYGRYCYLSTLKKYGDKPSTYITFNGTISDTGYLDLTATYHDVDLTEDWRGYLRYEEGMDGIYAYIFEGTMSGGDRTTTFDVSFYAEE